MYVCYFDEVKSNTNDGKHWYIVGGIVVAMADIALLEEKVSELAKGVFGDRELTPDTEFHSKDIYYGKRKFKGMQPTERLQTLVKLISLIGNEAPVKRVYAAINTQKLFKKSQAAEFAFMHFCERVHGAIPPKSTAILIGDLDEGQASNMTKEFSRYRTTGTSSEYGRIITKIVDSVHFCRSHHSRLIQLADAYVFRVSDYFDPRTSGLAGTKESD